MPTPLQQSIQQAALQQALSQNANDDQQQSVAAPPPQKGIGLAPYLALMGGNAADTLSTWKVLSSGAGHEGNPILPKSPGAIAGVKAAMTIPEAFIMKKLTDMGHPTAAKLLGYGIGALGAGIATHNSTIK